MPIFQSITRSVRKTPAQCDLRRQGLELFAELAGGWRGRFDELDEVAANVRRIPVRLKVQVNPQGSHIQVHYSSPGKTKLPYDFEVIAVDHPSGELVRTLFSDNLQELTSYSVAAFTRSRRKAHWQLVLTRIGWDQARPCEFRLRYDLAGASLTVTKECRLLGQATEFEVMSAFVLQRQTR